ncbi:hypothetical protein D3C86_1173540 [compost metagenome]
MNLSSLGIELRFHQPELSLEVAEEHIRALMLLPHEKFAENYYRLDKYHEIRAQALAQAAFRVGMALGPFGTPPIWSEPEDRDPLSELLEDE